MTMVGLKEIIGDCLLIVATQGKCYHMSLVLLLCMLVVEGV